MWRIPPAPPGFFRLGQSLPVVEDTGAYFVSHVQFCEVYYQGRAFLGSRMILQATFLAPQAKLFGPERWEPENPVFAGPPIGNYLSKGLNVLG